MNESAFILKNKESWEQLEALLKKPHKDPDQLQELFTKVSSDLSYARTFYPNRTVRLYLNGLTQRVLDLIQNRKSSFSFDDIKEFYLHDLPQQLWRARKTILVSFLIFSLAILIGVVSTMYNPEFTRVILGDQYVEMTNENINKGDPMAVYKSQGQVDMFFGITINNIRVAFLAFVLGLFGSVGTVMLLMFNGIMLGTFQFFFYKKGLFLTSFLTIWIHGTIEISAIIIAGAAGLILGDGLLYPKTYSRSLSMQVASKRALRVLMSTVPLFVMAGFLESFITRLTGLPTIVKAGIILISLLFIVYHYIIYPYRYQLKNEIPEDDYDVQPSQLEYIDNNLKRYRTLGESTQVTLAQARLRLGSVLYRGVLPMLLLITSVYWVWAKLESMIGEYSYPYQGYHLLFDHDIGGFSLYAAYAVGLIHLIAIITMAYHKIDFAWRSYFLHLKRFGLGIIFIVGVFFSVFYFFDNWATIILFCIIPPQIPFLFFFNLINEEESFAEALRSAIKDGYAKYIQFLSSFLLISFVYLLLWALTVSLTEILYGQFLSWYELFPGNISNGVYIDCIFRMIAGSISLTLYYFMYSNVYQSILCKDNSYDLKERIASFGLQKSNG